MEPLLILPVIAFAILLVLFGLVLRRAGRFLAQTRDVERFRRQAGDLVGRVETSLAEISTRIDAVRRGQMGADALADDLKASLDAVARYTDEARALRPAASAAAIRDEIIGELERTARALEMVEHGRSIQTSARAGARELEAQTSIKRGYLNILHAREAIVRQGHAAAGIPVGEGGEPFQRRGGA